MVQAQLLQLVTNFDLAMCAGKGLGLHCKHECGVVPVGHQALVGAKL